MFRPVTLKPFLEPDAIMDGLSEPAQALVMAYGINHTTMVRMLHGMNSGDRSDTLNAVVTMHAEAIAFAIVTLAVGDKRQIDASIKIASSTLEAITALMLEHGKKAMPPECEAIARKFAADYTDSDIDDRLHAELRRIEKMRAATTFG